MKRTRFIQLLRFGRNAWEILRDNRSGVALTEFALGFPVLFTLAMFGVETANLALTHLKISQIALNLADNASRVGVAGLASQQMREYDINDIIQGARLQGQSIGLTTKGRITLSSLENQSGTQMIHWQRCVGLKSGAGYDSSYGTTTTTDGTDNTAANDGTPAPSGMGDPGSMVNAPTGSGVIFVEVNYLYTPMMGWLASPSRLHYVASFIIRDPRDFSQIFPYAGATPATCNLYTT